MCAPDTEHLVGAVYSDQSSTNSLTVINGTLNAKDCMSCSSAASEISIWRFPAGEFAEPSPYIDYQRDANNDDATFRQQEDSRCCCSYLSTTQAAAGITAAQRASVIDNMILSAAHLGLSNDALFKAVACLDRYLAAKATPLNLLQPVGVACLWISAKYEQLVIPAAANFAQLVLGSNGVPLCNAPAAKQLLVLLEAEVLKALDYRLASFATIKGFKHRIMQQLSSSSAGAVLSVQQLDQLYCMTSYLTEVALLEYQLLPWLPSQIAAAAYGYAHVLLDLPLDVNLMQWLTQHSATEVQRVMEYLCALHATLCVALQLGKPYAVTVKYMDPQVGHVAAIAPVSSIADVRLTDW